MRWAGGHYDNSFTTFMYVETDDHKATSPQPPNFSFSQLKPQVMQLHKSLPQYYAQSERQTHTGKSREVTSDLYTAVYAQSSDNRTSSTKAASSSSLMLTGMLTA
jgi:hypothetical protein